MSRFGPTIRSEVDRASGSVWPKYRAHLGSDMRLIPDPLDWVHVAGSQKDGISRWPPEP